MSWWAAIDQAEPTRDATPNKTGLPHEGEKQQKDLRFDTVSTRLVGS
jgi:hypothetical protein